ncbi:hypothetical protein I551_7149 [Mycobacterium ulcerans str. Harvey]|uniref:Luciferase-like monooxygenase family protein n=1 Tax=Mycobacterium ulcerans str. Harvey TaxID=1299332 RepID=A0ABN0QNY9_MYCUL|nr:hypothetical protein I551_7149 [Mycobacterium ulcerans str. Harvey]
MRFSYAEAMTDPSFYVPLAQAAEAAGYHSMTIADSLAYPYESPTSPTRSIRTHPTAIASFSTARRSLKPSS